MRKAFKINTGYIITHLMNTWEMRDWMIKKTEYSLNMHVLVFWNGPTSFQGPKATFRRISTFQNEDAKQYTAASIGTKFLVCIYIFRT